MIDVMYGLDFLMKQQLDEDVFLATAVVIKSMPTYYVCGGIS